LALSHCAWPECSLAAAAARFGNKAAAILATVRRTKTVIRAADAVVVAAGAPAVATHAALAAVMDPAIRAACRPVDTGLQVAAACADRLPPAAALAAASTVSWAGSSIPLACSAANTDVTIDVTRAARVSPIPITATVAQMVAATAAPAA
jgi:hypothetical protein